MSKPNWSWEDIVDDNSSTFTASEFLFLFRMNRESFKKLANKIKIAKVFEPKPNTKKAPRPSWQQLLVFLFRIGKESSGGNDKAVASFFRISHGSVPTYINNITDAIKETMKKSYLRWHTKEEKNEMKVRCGVFGLDSTN